MLAELFGELAEEALPGFEDLGLIVGETLFDVIHAFDHDAPEEDGEPNISAQRSVLPLSWFRPFGFA